MRMIFALGFVVVVGAPTLALAGPITAGVSVGTSESTADVSTGSSEAFGLWGRLQFSKRVSGQLEVSRYSKDDNTNLTIRMATAALVVDLMDHGQWMPTLIAGLGVDEARDELAMLSTRGHHIEGGLGLEYRAAGGITFGADVRIGNRSFGDIQDPRAFDDGTLNLVAPNYRNDGEYTAARITVGVRF